MVSDADWISLWRAGRVKVAAGSPRVLHEYETPTAVVFLTATHAFKLRKPVSLSYVDYSSQAQRRLAARTELAIGARISPQLYLGVWTLVAAAAPRLMPYDAAGEPLVVMARLSHELQLERLFSSLSTAAERIDDVAAACAAFHARCPSDRRPDGYGAPAHAARAWASYFAELAPTAVPLPLSAAEQLRLRDETAQRLHELTPLLTQRIAEGRVRDGHGDLRLKHVYLTRPWSVIDPLEFSRELRFTDVAAEVGYLAMELDDLGRYDASERLLAKYAAATQDSTLAAVAPLFKRWRAVARARSAWARAAQSAGARRDAYLSRSRRLFELALSY
jgi:aminoglycoside phosphotransferase family enzyme